MKLAELKRFTEANREAWNEVMPYHQVAAREKWDRLFAQPGALCLSAREVDLLQKVGIQGKNVAHLCCNNGVELLSLKNLGAGECTGFDISDAAIEEARERAERFGIDCRYVRTDVYEIGDKYHQRYDMIYISAGCLGWMPDLKRFFARVAALLRDDGLVFIHEIHPFGDLFPTGGHADAGSLHVIEPYFRSEPYVEQGYLDYVGNTAYPSITTQYWFMHTLSAIITEVVENGMAIEKFCEYENAISPHHYPLQAANARIPLSYILIARKEMSR